MGKHTPTKKQEEFFKEVEKAFIKARKAGLVFYGKCGSLVAYKKNADDYIEQDFEGSLATGLKEIEFLSSNKCIIDSGADDYGSYRNESDLTDFG